MAKQAQKRARFIITEQVQSGAKVLVMDALGVAWVIDIDHNVAVRVDRLEPVVPE